MVGRPGVYQPTFTAGEIDPGARGSTQLKSYYAGAELMQNFQIVPQGGFKVSPGGRLRGRARRALTSVETVAIGAIAGVATATVIWSGSFAANRTVAAIDLTGFVASRADNAILVLETRPSGGAWAQLGPAMTLRTVAATIRCALPPNETRLVREIRLRTTLAPGSATDITVTNVQALTMAASGVPAVRARAFTYSRTDAYVFVTTPGHADIWRAGTRVWVGSVAWPTDATQTLESKPLQRRDTMLLLHEDLLTRRILRLANDLWAIDSAPFTFIPDVDYGGAYVNVAEKWSIYLQWPTADFTFGTQFMEITVSGETTDAIEIDAADWPATIANMQAALIALPSIEAGLVVTAGSVDQAGGKSFDILFDGAGNAGENYEVTARVVSTTQVSATSSRTLRGKKGGEALFSVTRGYAAAGIYFQDRLTLAGFKSQAGAILASRTGEYFDLNVEAEAASGAILVGMDTDGAEQVIQLARGRHLIIHTTDAEYFISDRALARTTAPNLVRSSGIGTSRQIPIVEQEGSILFANRDGSVVYAATYDDVKQAYDPQPLSLLASHLMDGLVDAALEKASQATDADRYWAPRADGVLVCGHLLRNQEITGFTRDATDGQVKAVCVDGANEVWTVVERTINGQQELLIETLEEDLLLDSAVTLAAAGSATFNVPHLAGATVWVIADGLMLHTTFDVAANGDVTIDEIPTTSVTIGRWTAPDAITLPLVRDIGPRQVLKRPARVHTVKLDVMDTTSLAVGANGRAPRDVALSRIGDPVDAPPTPRTGEIAVTGLMGFTTDGQIRITQVRPGKLHIRSITMEARL